MRHQVLWPDKPLEFCMVEGDEQAKHFGVYDDDKLVSVAYLYFDRTGSDAWKVARLRKFATLTECQGKGFGSALFQHLLQELQFLKINELWFDARESAEEFYAFFGCEIKGHRFFKSKIPYIRMSKLLSDTKSY